ncbi:MAG: alpha/beta hydrolase [Candidatus Zixiibacteriota bacterium]
MALGLYLYFNQGRMVFMPLKELALIPTDVLDFPYEDIYVPVTAKEKIHAWYFPDEVSTKAVLFCHGNAGNISHRMETVAYLRGLGVSVMLFDYRGYGLSDGSPSEPGVYRDTRAAYDWLIDKRGFLPEDIVVFGRSLGGAAAIDLAGEVKCGGLVVESSFTSAYDIGKTMFPFFPVSYLLRYRFDSLEKIKHVTCPVLVTHSPADDMIPYEMGRKLFEAAPEPKTFVALSGDHNSRDYFADNAYRRALQNIIGISPTDRSGR